MVRLSDGDSPLGHIHYQQRVNTVDGEPSGSTCADLTRCRMCSMAYRPPPLTLPSCVLWLRGLHVRHARGQSQAAYFSEVNMYPHQKLTKQEERKAMLGLMKQRQRSTPQRHDPCWVYLFWHRVAS